MPSTRVMIVPTTRVSAPPESSAAAAFDKETYDRAHRYETSGVLVADPVEPQGRELIRARQGELAKTSAGQRIDYHRGGRYRERHQHRQGSYACSARQPQPSRKARADHRDSGKHRARRIARGPGGRGSGQEHRYRRHADITSPSFSHP